MSVYGFARLIPNIQRKILLDLATNCNFVSQEYTTEIRTIIEGPDVFIEVIDSNIIRTLYIYIKLIVFNIS